MIVSFHPIITADENRIVAGRPPDESDLAAIRRADAVILPQGCMEPLYRMARTNCPHLFPNMDVRFDYPGKLGQIRLFRKLATAHPKTELFESTDRFYSRPADIALPAVVKMDFGGQGETVYKVDDADALEQTLRQVKAFERTGQTGFLVQQFIPTKQRSLRVTVIGRRTVAYWRIAPKPDRFAASVADGARIDHEADPELKAAAVGIAGQFCARTGLQLAGFDFLFDSRSLDQGRIEPLMLEINYFFGRAGLGGSERFYTLLTEAVDTWLNGLGLRRGQT